MCWHRGLGVIRGLPSGNLFEKPVHNTVRHFFCFSHFPKKVYLRCVISLSM